MHVRWPDPPPTPRRAWTRASHSSMPKSAAWKCSMSPHVPACPRVTRGGRHRVSPRGRLDGPPSQARRDGQARPPASSSTTWCTKAAAIARRRATGCRWSRSTPRTAERRMEVALAVKYRGAWAGAQNTRLLCIARIPEGIRGCGLPSRGTSPTWVALRARWREKAGIRRRGTRARESAPASRRLSR